MLKDKPFEEFIKFSKSKNVAGQCIDENITKKGFNYPGGAFGRNESGKKRDSGEN